MLTMASSSRPDHAAPKSTALALRLYRHARMLAVVAACSLVAVAAGCADAPIDLRVEPPQHAYTESLIVSLEDVRHLANFEGLQPYSYADRHHPVPGNLHAPGPCRAVGSSDLTFTAGWKEFRAVAYSGADDDPRPGGIAPINEVTHAVALYRDTDAAQDALTQLESTLGQCASLHERAYAFTLSKPDPATLKLSSEGWSHLYRAKNTVLASVGVLGIEPTEQIAYRVLQTITDRIR